MKFVLTICVLLITLISFSENTEKVILINEQSLPLNLNEYTYTFLTKKQDASIEYVLKKEFQSTPSGLNIGLNDKIYWIKYELSNPTNKINICYLFYPYNHINKINVYSIYNDSIVFIKAAGTFYPQNDRFFVRHGYSIPLGLKPGLTTIILEVEHLYLPLRGAAFLLTEQQLLKTTIETQTLLSFWQGIMIFVLLLSIVLYIILKIKSILYYFFLNFGILLFINAEMGNFFLLFNSDSLDFIINIKQLANIIVLFALPLFINEITSISKVHPRLWKIIILSLSIGPVLWLICLVPSVKQTHFLYYTTLYFILYSAVIFILILYLTFAAYIKKYRNALAVFIIYLFYFTAGFVNLILPNLGLLDSGLMIYDSFIYSSLFEIIAFMILIGHEILLVYNQRSILLEKEKNHQTEIIRAIVDSQEKERNKVGRELHDTIGANIVVIKQQVDRTNILLINLIERTIESVRKLSHGLVTPLIKDDDFIDEIEELCNLLSDANIDIQSHFHNWTRFENSLKATHLYRIVQELLQNAIKHSSASYVLIQFIMNDDNELTVMYEDNGTGFNYENEYNNHGLGLINIANRVKLIDSTIIYDTKEGGNGTTVTINVPV